MILHPRRRRSRVPKWILALTALVIAAASALLFASTGHAAKRTTDIYWKHPEFSRFGVRGVALLPVASYDHDTRTQALVAAAWGQQFQNIGYRWMTTTSSAAILRNAGGDSLIRSFEKSLLDQGRVDSLQAPGLCARLHVDALLSLRVDRWEQNAIEEDQRGKPSTTVKLTAALVDSAGRLLWYGSGAETVEGIEHIPVSTGGGSRIGEAQLSASSADTRPPAYPEVLSRLLTRWGDQFPPPAAAPAASAAPDTTHH